MSESITLQVASSHHLGRPYKERFHVNDRGPFRGGRLVFYESLVHEKSVDTCTLRLVDLAWVNHTGCPH